MRLNDLYFIMDGRNCCKPAGGYTGSCCCRRQAENEYDESLTARNGAEAQERLELAHVEPPGHANSLSIIRFSRAGGASLYRKIGRGQGGARDNDLASWIALATQGRASTPLRHKPRSSACGYSRFVGDAPREATFCDDCHMKSCQTRTISGR
jgi:hypothetical protein